MTYTHQSIFAMSLVLCSVISFRAMGMGDEMITRLVTIRDQITTDRHGVAFTTANDRLAAFRDHYLVTGEDLYSWHAQKAYKRFCVLFPVRGVDRDPQPLGWFNPELKYLNKRPAVGALGLAAGAWYLLDKHNKAFREKFSRPALQKAKSLWESFKKSRPAQITAVVGGVLVAGLYWHKS